ncbi:hypothetical protein DQ04_04051060 [Trypanosoma grayi]|uniref:hypothetical protein n=1 Tax=Trypanosoma grayi TaxID=71804 RepID=UPI0004F40DE6|nr:hypothetical protein DQ04_04051060 [Trypanosoma grayi]KEG10207.1 hypothetical protein DQ04_04051060 [Trypanosoma grayi]
MFAESLKKAESERDDALRRLQLTSKEVEFLRARARQDESRRASFSCLPEPIRSGRRSPCRVRPTFCDVAGSADGSLAAEVGASSGSPMGRAASVRDDSIRQNDSVAMSSRTGSSLLTWTRHRCTLGEAWSSLVSQCPQLVEDVFVMEVHRAASVPVENIRRVEFLRSGSVVDLEVCHSGHCEAVNECLERHPFNTMAQLLKTTHPSISPTISTSGDSVSAVSQQLIQMNEQLQQQLLIAQLELEKHRPNQRASHVLNEDSTVKELELFRSRRVLSNSMRGLEETLLPSFTLQNNLDPKLAVDPSILRREPIYCVTLDEYRSILQQTSPAWHSETEEDEGHTRLWNEHVVARAEEERRFTDQLRQLAPQYCRRNDDTV